ncbi:MAG: helix-turn-helix domain-containing protein [Acidimicrobiales bacterium]|jgi:AcrR family transcriptional regulator
MAQDIDSENSRPLRADAQRNYDRLVAAAREVFTRDGGGASMEAIAKQAGVGVGTLYRHFPKRIDVVEAVYRNDVEELRLEAEKAVANLEAWPAVVAFLEAFVRYAQTKRTFLQELREAFDKNPELKSHSREVIDQAAQLVVGRAQSEGAIRTDVTGPDVMQLIGPMCTTATLTEEQSKRLLAMILDGLQHPSAEHGL